ncbi:pyocin knob domain-containing protein [Uliginosibacterium gangwonense]|uniref:pyocin knob domain-containing protein n=1 Tax=Uliginosibacterium gangwonense TaxID=392736 RepID=UPI00037A9A2C|nr:pyocin knob domain-containing protein [Uliginosibacterium gangwonense]
MGTINNETNLTESPTWEAGVYEFQTTDPVQGGPDGLDNKPTRQLANRTQFLRALCEALANTKAPLESPALTGQPTAPTAEANSHDEQVANTAFVQTAIAAAVSSAIASLVNNSPAALDTLNELATALGNDPNFATTITNALAAKAPLASPALTGTPTGPTAAAGTNTLQLATTAFVQAALSGKLTQTQTDALYAAIGHTHSGYAPLASPALTGTPTAPTATAGTNNAQLANTAFVQAAIAAAVSSAIASLVNNSPAALDTLNELATALGNDPNFATTITNALAAKAPLASPALTGTPTGPTAAAGTNNAQLATTAFVQAATGGKLTQAQTDALYAALGHTHNGYAPLASPALTGTPTAPTAAAGTNNAQLANTAFVRSALMQFGLGTNDLSDWVGDMNALTTSGLWLAATSTNAPNPAISAWFVIVLPNANGLYAAQLAMPQSVNELWFRAENAGVWSAWSKVVGSDSPALTGVPTAPTPPAWSTTDQVSNAYYVHNSIDLRFPSDRASYFCSNGWIIQLGRVNVANTGAFTTLTFPVAFPNRMVSFVGNIISPGVNVTTVLANADAATKTGIPVAVYNVGGAGGGTTPIFYLAIGF